MKCRAPWAQGDDLVVRNGESKPLKLPYLGGKTGKTPILVGTPKITEGSLEVKLPTIWTGEKQSREEAERRERLEERRVEEKEKEERRCRCEKR